MWWVFEIVIYFYLIAIGAFLIEVGTSWKKLEKKKRMAAAAVILGLGWLMIFYGSFIEVKTLVVREQAIALTDDTTTQIRAVVVSDLHVGPYKGTRWVQQVVYEMMAQEPDIIFLAGDFIFGDADEVDMLEPLAQLSAPLGVYAVTGNHDYLDDASPYLIDTLMRHGITVLENERETIVVGEQELIIAGVSDMWFDGNTHRTLAGVDDEKPVILISHNPDAVLYSNADRADLVISGHTHGGQIRLPWIGSLVNLPTILGDDYDKGLFEYGDQQLFITPGVSETGPRARLFNPPTINVLTISF